MDTADEDPNPNVISPQRIRLCLSASDAEPDEKHAKRLHSDASDAAGSSNGSGSATATGSGSGSGSGGADPFEDEIDPEAPRDDEQSGDDRDPSPPPAATPPPAAAAAAPINYTDYYSNGGGGLCGLPNLGNTCYYNSSLQALLHCPPLVGFVLEPPPSFHPPSEKPSTAHDPPYSLAQAAEPDEPQPNENADLVTLRLRLVEDLTLLTRKAWSAQYKAITPRDLLYGKTTRRLDLCKWQYTVHSTDLQM